MNSNGKLTVLLFTDDMISYVWSTQCDHQFNLVKLFIEENNNISVSDLQVNELNIWDLSSLVLVFRILSWCSDKIGGSLGNIFFEEVIILYWCQMHVAIYSSFGEFMSI